MYPPCQHHRHTQYHTWGKLLLLLTVLLLQALRFLPTTPMPGRGIPLRRMVIAESRQYHLQSKPDEHSKRPLRVVKKEFKKIAIIFFTIRLEPCGAWTPRHFFFEFSRD